MDQTAQENGQDNDQMNGKERREHVRLERLGLTVCFDGQTYTTANWSMGGFLVEGYDGQLSTGSLVTIAAMGTADDTMHDVDLAARVVRAGANVLAVNYLSLDAEAYDLLQTAMSSTGEMRSLLD